MALAQVLNEIRRRGIDLTVDGDRLRYRPTNAVPAEFRAALIEHKAELLRLLLSWDAAAADRLWAGVWAQLEAEHEALPPGCPLDDSAIDQAEDAFNACYLAQDLDGVRAAVELFATACRRRFAAWRTQAVPPLTEAA